MHSAYFYRLKSLNELSMPMMQSVTYILYAYCNNLLLTNCMCMCRKDLASIQKDYEETKERLRHKEVMATATGSGQRVGGLCLKCAQHEAVLAETHSNVHVQTIERLTK